MKKIINWFYQTFVKSESHKDEVKGCLELTFKNKTLAQSIAINQKYKEAFESELNQRHIKAFNELELIEDYFHPKRKPIYKIDVNDPAFEQPIKK